jgi:superfamily II DNA helicase RecQ
MAQVRQLLNDCAKDFDPALVLKCKQIECFEHNLSGKDVIVNLPVGYGKSLVLKLAAMFLSHHTTIVTWVSEVAVVKGNRCEEFGAEDVL